MKNILYITIFALIFVNCNNNDDTDFTNNPPRIEILTPEISGLVGEVVSIHANFSDDYVLKHVRITNIALGIQDKVFISIINDGGKNSANDIIKSEEDFNYDITIPSTAVSG